MGTLLIAVVLLAQPADSVTVPGVVVDPAGKPVSDVEVVLVGPRRPDGSVSAAPGLATPPGGPALAVRRRPSQFALTLARTMTDVQGAFRLEVDRQRLQEIGPFRVILAYRLGRTVAMQQAELEGNGVLPPFRLTLATPFKRTVTVRDPNGRPIASVRLVPVVSESNGREGFSTPDDWLERLTVATDADGVATLLYFPVTVDPVRVRVTAPGIIPHIFPLPDRPGSDRFTLKVGRPARLAGSVFDASGQPAANVPVEVWMEIYNSGSNPGDNPKPAGFFSLIHFDSGPIRTGADGTFRTPPQLMTGWSYQISVRPEGDPPARSESMIASSELTTVPPLRLHHPQRRKLIGLVHDRQGRPVAGARVFLPSGAPSTRTDAQGRFLLEGVLPARTYILVQAEGFQLQGWPGVPASQPQERTHILARTSEPADRTLKPLPDPSPREEARALALRVLEPYLQAALEKGDDQSRYGCLSLLSKIDPARALERLKEHPFQNPGWEAGLRVPVATELLATDPVEAESIIAAIARPGERAWSYVLLAEALPNSERDRKRRLLERATVQVRAPAGAGRGADPQIRLIDLGRVAGGWLDIGEVEEARPLVREAWETAAVRPKGRGNDPDFLKAAARFELDRVLARIRDISDASLRRDRLIAVAESLASDHPAEAERVFQLIEDRPEAHAYQHKDIIALRLCRRMAKTDPDRARRLIAGLKSPRQQACAWALMAFVLVDRDKPAARSALSESIRLIDRLSGYPDRAELAAYGAGIAGVAGNPAASILPIVEKVAPERLEDVFWKAVALMPKHDMVLGQRLPDSRIAQAAIFLARYDRQVAGVFVTEEMTYRASQRIGGYAGTIVRARASVDPRGAVAMIEALPPVSFNRARGTNVSVMNSAREALVTCLVEPIEEHWKVIWMHSLVPVDGRRFP